MNEPLIPKQNYANVYQRATQLIKEAKELNDEIQATDESDFDKMKDVLDNSRTSQLNYAEELKTLFEKLDKLGNLSEQKKKIKELKDQYTKEVQRYKIIQKNLIDQGYEIRRQTLHRRSTQAQQINKKNPYESTVTLKQSQLEQQQLSGLVEIDQIEIDNALIKEQQDEITKIEKNAIILNKVVNDISTEVDKQGKQLDVVEINMEKVQDNLKVTVKELDGAQLEQRKTMKKYIILGIIALVLVVVLGFLVWHLTKASKDPDDTDNYDNSNSTKIPQRILLQFII